MSTDRPAPAEPAECGRKFAFADYTCRRLNQDDGSPHLGLHRNTRTARHATVMWGDNECTSPEPRENHRAQ